MGSQSAPLETFELVSDETRVAILRTLADAFREDPTDPTLDYSDLRERVGVRDKGNFNYHLDRLNDLLLDGVDGYAVSSVGLTVVSALAAGSFDTDWTWGPTDVPGECFFCGDGLALRYEHGHLLLTCGRDDHTLLFPAAPSLFDGHSDAAAVERVAFILSQQAAAVERGICPECQGDVMPSIVPEPDPAHGGYFFHGDCQRCGFQHGFPAGAAALSHPDVVAALAAKGSDPRTTPFWTFEWCHVGRDAVVSDDPLRVALEAELTAETLSITLDDEATVVSVEREK